MSPGSEMDSVTIRIRFYHGLLGTLARAQVRLIRASDSTEVRIVRVDPAAAHDSILIKESAARADSIARADTSAKGRLALARADSARRVAQRDSAARAQLEAIRSAHDTVRRVPPPKPDRPVPFTEFVIVIAQPLPVLVMHRLIVRDSQALDGPPRTSDRPVVRPKPPPPPKKDSSAVKKPPPLDTTAARKAAPRDTTGVRKPPPRDTTVMPGRRLTVSHR